MTQFLTEKNLTGSYLNRWFFQRFEDEYACTPDFLVTVPTDVPITFSIPAPDAKVKIRSVIFPENTRPIAPSDSANLVYSELAPIGSLPEPSALTITAWFLFKPSNNSDQILTSSGASKTS